jgi:hypothetical protein
MRLVLASISTLNVLLLFILCFLILVIQLTYSRTRHHTQIVEFTILGTMMNKLILGTMPNCNTTSNISRHRSPSGSLSDIIRTFDQESY